MAANRITAEPSPGSAAGPTLRLAELTDAIGELSTVERETIARTRQYRCPRWKVAGRDHHGQLVLATLLPAGERWPTKRRLCLMTIAAEGLYYHERLVNATDRDGGPTTDQTAGGRHQSPDPGAGGCAPPSTDHQ